MTSLNKVHNVTRCLTYVPELGWNKPARRGLQRKLKIFPNKKAWITKRIKGIINSKKLAFQKNEKEEYRSAQKELKEKILKERE